MFEGIESDPLSRTYRPIWTCCYCNHRVYSEDEAIFERLNLYDKLTVRLVWKLSSMVGNLSKCWLGQNNSGDVSNVSAKSS